MNPNQVRTINVRYSMVFMITMATLFIFSQVIDYLFYDFTIVETEIVFIKRVDQFNNMQIELNEIVESQNSLVQALKSNLKNKIEYIQKRISSHYEDETDILQLEANMGYKQDININSKAYLLKSSYLEPYGETVDSLYIMSIQNKVNEFGSSFMLNIYQDHGTNFFDMAQQINLNFIWNKFLTYAINGSYISDMIQDYNQLLLVSQNELYLIDQLKHKHQFQSISMNQSISSIAVHGNHIVFCNNNKLFHHLTKMQLIQHIKQ